MRPGDLSVWRHNVWLLLSAALCYLEGKVRSTVVGNFTEKVGLLISVMDNYFIFFK